MASAIELAPWPHFDDEQVQAAADVLRSGKVNYWTGTVARDFEREFAAWCGAGRGIAVSNGTVSLELIAQGLGLKPGDEVITTPRTFIASASAFVIHGIRPVLADIDRDSGNITPETVAPLITERTRAIVPVHLGGWPCDMPGLRALADERKLAVIEDCAQAHGAKIGGRHVGSWSEAASWSFCQDKIMTTGGEGGMVTTDDEGLWKRMWSLKDHGKAYDTVYHRQHPPGFRWLHENWGTNWRMTEIQAALGRVQIGRMPEWHAARAANAARYAELLGALPGIRMPLPGPGITHAWYRLYFYIEESALKDGWNRDRIHNECHARGLPISVGSCSEIYLEKCFQKCRLAPEEPLPAAAELSRTALALQVHPGITAAQMDQTAGIIAGILGEAKR